MNQIIYPVKRLSSSWGVYNNIYRDIDKKRIISVEKVIKNKRFCKKTIFDKIKK